MRRFTFKRILPLIFVFCIAFSTFGPTCFANTSVSSETGYETSATKIEEFVTRMYRITLGREPEEGGFKYWCQQVSERKITAGGLAYQFIFGPEFQNRIAKEKMTSTQYITCHYNLFMGREPEKAGLDFWVGHMGDNWNTDAKKKELFIGFVNSKEFRKICQSYGMLQGYYDPNHTPDQNTSVALFTDRLYQIILGRNSEAEGLFFWTEQLLKGNIDGATLGLQFVFSKEFKNLKLSNEEFLSRLYRAFMDREPDEAGMAYWLSLIEAGAPREAIFSGFIHSPEFTKICKQYGIGRGSLDLPSTEAYDRIAAVNKLRAAEGGKPLKTTDMMQKWADIRVQEISVYFSHYRQDGSKYSQVGRNLGIAFGASAENIAAGAGGCMDTLDQVINAWMNSEGHRQNLLNPRYNRAAMGRLVAADGTVYWTLVLAEC